MFDTFIFGTNTSCSDVEISASPTDCSFPPNSRSPSFLDTRATTGKIGGLNDIVNRLSQHTLYPDEEDERPRASIWRDSGLLSPNFDHEGTSGFTNDQSSYIPKSGKRQGTGLHHTTQSVPSIATMPSPQGTVACRRLQRQLNVQLQNCPSHLRDINALVSEMVTNNSQCRLRKPSPPPVRHNRPSELDYNCMDIREHEQPLTPDEDEGFGDIVDEELRAIEEEMSLRRAGMPSGIRKYSVVKWKKSAECVQAYDRLGRLKVRNVPRMRRRPKNPATETQTS